MQAGQFVKGIFNGSTESYQTDNIQKFLSSEEFDKLWNLERLGSWLYTNQEEGVIARSTITRTNDGAFTGRKGVINHTVIVKFDGKLEKDGVTYRLDRASITDELARNTPALNSPFPILTQPLPPVGGDT